MPISSEAASHTGRCILFGFTSPREEAACIRRFADALEKPGEKSPSYKNYIEKDGFKDWAAYTAIARSLQYTDFTKSKQTIGKDMP